jgi:hypothetical protein
MKGSETVSKSKKETVSSPRGYTFPIGLESVSGVYYEKNYNCRELEDVQDP